MPNRIDGRKRERKKLRGVATATATVVGKEWERQSPLKMSGKRAHCWKTKERGRGGDKRQKKVAWKKGEGKRRKRGGVKKGYVRSAPEKLQFFISDLFSFYNSRSERLAFFLPLYLIRYTLASVHIRCCRRGGGTHFLLGGARFSHVEQGEVTKLREGGLKLGS